MVAGIPVPFSPSPSLSLRILNDKVKLLSYSFPPNPFQPKNLQCDEARLECSGFWVADFGSVIQRTSAVYLLG